MSAEAKRAAGEPYLRIVERFPGDGIPLSELRPVAGGRLSDEGRGVTLTSAPGFGAYSAEFSLQASQDAYRTFVLRCRPLQGDIQLGVLASDRSRRLSVAAPEPNDDGSLTQACTIRLGRKRRAHLVIANGTLGPDERPSHVVLEQITGLVQAASQGADAR